VIPLKDQHDGFFLIFSLQSFSDGVRFYTGGLPEDEIRLKNIILQCNTAFTTNRSRSDFHCTSITFPLRFGPLSSASLVLPPFPLLPCRVPTSLCSKICNFHRTPPAATSKMYTIQRHRCSWRRGISIESEYVVASQWTSSCFLIVSCIFIATHVTSLSTWEGIIGY
jgi:hypothetical protein